MTIQEEVTFLHISVCVVLTFYFLLILIVFVTLRLPYLLVNVL